MKRASSRFVRLFLVVALVTAIAGSLVPVTKAAGAVDVGSVTLSSTSAGKVAQYTIGVNHLADVPIGGTLTVTFPLGTTVPSSIAATAISVSQVSSTPTTKVLNLAPTVAARAVTLISPLAIGKGSSTIIFATTAGITNPTAKAYIGAKTLSVSSSAEVAGTTGSYTIAQTFVVSPASAARGATVSVSGAGYTGSTAGTIFIGSTTVGIATGSSTGGSFTVDASGNLTGSFVAGSVTNKAAINRYLYIQDQGDGTLSVSKSYTQKASATPASTSATPGSTVSVTLSDFNASSAITSTTALVANTEPAAGYSTNTLGGSTAAYSFTLPNGTSTGTKTVVVRDASAKTASFLLTVVNRTITVTPTSGVPGQAVTISGTGFTKSSAGTATTSITLNTSTANVAVVTPGTPISLATDGTFLYTGTIPFDDTITATGGTKTWTATDTGYLVGTSSGFSIQSRSLALSPSTGGPGSIITVTGAGFGKKTNGGVSSQVTLSMSGSVTGAFSVTSGPFPITATGEFTGSVTIPVAAKVETITITATDNNGAAGTNGFTANKTKTKTLSITAGTVTVSPTSGSTGTLVTITGSNFPSQTNLSALTFGTASALPIPAPATDTSGNFTVTIAVPAAAAGGSLVPGSLVIKGTVSNISGTTSFTIPSPGITISPATGKAGETISITGTGFSAYSTVGTINVGAVNQAPSPNPITDALGGFTTTVTIPALNPGAYTVTVTAPTGGSFTGTAQLTITSASAAGSAVIPATAFQALTNAGILTLASASSPGGTSFGAFVPDLPGDTLAEVQPFGVLILNLSAAANISVSGQTAVAVAADTPTFFAVGSSVTIEVVS